MRFPSNHNFNNISMSWGGRAKAALIKNFRFHDLRYDFSSKLVMAGVDLNTIRELSRHADIKNDVALHAPCAGKTRGSRCEAERCAV